MEKGRTRKINSANLFLEVFLIKYFMVTKPRDCWRHSATTANLRERKFKTPTKPTGGLLLSLKPKLHVRWENALKQPKIRRQLRFTNSPSFPIPRRLSQQHLPRNQCVWNSLERVQFNSNADTPGLQTQT